MTAASCDPCGAPRPQPAATAATAVLQVLHPQQWASSRPPASLHAFRVEPLLCGTHSAAPTLAHRIGFGVGLWGIRKQVHHMPCSCSRSPKFFLSLSSLPDMLGSGGLLGLAFREGCLKRPSGSWRGWPRRAKAAALPRCLLCAALAGHNTKAVDRNRHILSPHCAALHRRPPTSYLIRP